MYARLVFVRDRKKMDRNRGKDEKQLQDTVRIGKEREGGEMCIK